MNLLGLASRLLVAPRAMFFVVVCVVAVARTGIGEYSLDVLEISRRLPRPSETYKGLSVLSPIVARLLGVESRLGWWTLHAVLTVLAIALGVLLARRRLQSSETRRVLLVLVAASAMPVVLLSKIGHYDIWLVVGSILVSLGAGRIAPIVGGLIVGFTNFEQGAVLVLALLAAQFSLGLAREMIRSLTFAAAAVFGRGVIEVWYRSFGVLPTGRGSLLRENLVNSLEGFVKPWPIQLYSWYSAAWVLVIAMIVGLRAERVRMFALLASLLIIPGIATVITSDGARVFMATSSASLLYVTSRLLMSFEQTVEGDTAAKIGNEIVANAPLCLLIMLVTPGITVWGGSLQTPWAQTLLPLFERLSG